MDLRKLDLKIVKVLCGMVGHLNHLMVAHTASPSNYCHQGHRLPLMQSVYHDLGLSRQCPNWLWKMPLYDQFFPHGGRTNDGDTFFFCRYAKEGLPHQLDTQHHERAPIPSLPTNLNIAALQGQSKSRLLVFHKVKRHLGVTFLL